jgi:hypothetical protein
MFGLGPIELLPVMFFAFLPVVLIVVLVVVFLKLFSQMARDLNRISQSMQNIEGKLLRKEKQI